MGFNDSNGNFWLGNELLHQLTKDGRYKLRFDLRYRTTGDVWRYAVYSSFVVASEASKYLMHMAGYSGNWEDAFSSHNGAKFTTYDSDNDAHATLNCADHMGGGFWWTACGSCGVNTPLSSGFRWSTRSSGFNLLISRMWLTC